MNSLVTVKSYASRLEANVVKGFLEFEGIKTVIFADDAEGSYPMTSFSSVVLKVDFKDVKKAKKLLRSKKVKE